MGVKTVIPKLENIWSIGGSDKEAAFYADISPNALCRYLQSHPEISERKEALLQKPNLRARQEVIRGLIGNPEFSLKYLERKLPNEFSTKIDQNVSGGLDIEIHHIRAGNEKKDKPKSK